MQSAHDIKKQKQKQHEYPGWRGRQNDINFKLLKLVNEFSGWTRP